jgi:tRNA threonylcarbamoyladenosine biosynthesis protein TsaB
VRILALDTSSSGGSAAVVRDGAIAAQRAGDASRTHGERLPRELMAVLDAAHVTLADVDRFAVCIGPGSFTGLRIGIATIQGLALAAGKPVAPVSSFEALAFSMESADAASALGSQSSSAKAIWIDAHRGEVFASLYAADGAVLHGPTSLAPEATLDAWSAALAGIGRLRFTGNGAVKYREVIERRLGSTAGIPAGVPGVAGAIGLIAAADPGRAVRPYAIVPLYVRRSDAELTRERRQRLDGR